MSRAVVIIRSPADRALATRWVNAVPVGARIEFKKPRRSLPQNDRMWAMLTDLATQVPYNGLRLTPDDFKLIFLDALKREVRMVPNLDGNGMVSLGRSSSDLSVEEMSDMFLLMEKFGAEHGVVFGDEKREQAA
jgi:hypothetical protein